MKRSLYALTVVVSTFVFLLATPSPAYACSCAEFVLEDSVSEIGLAFVGTQVDYDVEDEFENDGAKITFEVERVYDGDASETTEVRTHAQSSACGVNFGDGNRVAVVGWGEGRSVGLCTSSITEADLLRVYGDGYAPSADPVSSLESGVSTARYVVIGGVVLAAAVGVYFARSALANRQGVD
ncbi:MAG: hypothetical protein HKN94_15490 [Acidimicrobiales bacterium]|nr:hypothetical protein [Acidimicrobiales bacterium]RZV47320.1 MAG: hypothetical protein EX269_05020 [Acidimicrobiales bacterium]